MKTLKQIRGAAVVASASMALAACGGSPVEQPTTAQPPGSMSFAASIAHQNQEADRALNLLVRLEPSPNELFEIYEPSPGRIIVSGAGAPSQPAMVPKDIADLTLERIWSRVAGARPMPGQLTAAMQRMELRRTEPRALIPAANTPPTSSGGSPVGPAAPEPVGAAAGEQLQVGYCDSDYYVWGYDACDSDWHICVDNWWNGASAYHPDVEGLYANVCPNLGSVTLKITSDEWDGGSWNVPQNTMRWYRAIQHGCDEYWWNDCPNARGQVLNATGDRFHFRFLVDEPSPCDAC